MFFKLSPLKLDLIYFSKSSGLIESLLSIDISSNLSLAPSTIHTLSFIFGSSLSLIPQIKSVAKSSFFLCRIKQLKLFLDNPTLKLLVSLLICPALTIVTLYYGLPETTLHPLTKAFKSAAHSVSGTYKFSHITSAFIFLHWLPLKK